MAIRSGNSIDRQAESLAHMSDFSNVDDPVITVQDPSTDIVVIARQVMNTGVLPNIALEPLIDFDVSDIDDYGSVLRKIAAAEHAFMQLDPRIRAKFDNDPKKAQAAFSAMSPKEIEDLIRGEAKNTEPGTTEGNLPGPGPAAAPGGDPNPQTGGDPPGPKPNP